MSDSNRPGGRYSRLIAHIFSERYESGLIEVPFERDDIVQAAEALGITLPKNLGDVVYSMRYRTELPAEVRETAVGTKQWVIQGRGRSAYAFCLVSVANVEPNRNLLEIKIPDSTPEVVNAYALSDEQALLARVRYNRLIDLFLGIVAYSLQNHLRTTVIDIGQVEIDEIYVGLDRRGRHYILPVQAKGGADRLSSVQALQDISCCRQKYPNLVCRAIGAQFMRDDLIALFELTEIEGEVRVAAEQHYKLVPADQITSGDLEYYSR